MSTEAGPSIAPGDTPRVRAGGRRRIRLSLPAWRPPLYLSRVASIAALHGPILGVLAVIAATNVAFMDDSFHGDDYVAFTEFKTTSFLEFSERVFKFEDLNFYWRPLGKIFHRAMFEAFGFNEIAFHGAALAFFLATAWAIWLFCLREGMNRFVGLGAAAVFGLSPNHVVSVTWITNTSRLMAVFCFLVCLLLLQRRRRFAPLLEAGAFAFFTLAVLCDETALALAPLPLLYTVHAQDRFSWRASVLRAAAYAAVVAVLLPMQFGHPTHNDPRTLSYGLGPHVWTTSWVLVSQLSLPLTDPAPFDIFLGRIPDLQWAAGLATVVAGVLLVLFGSKRARFLVLWTGAALAPFALWDLTYTSPRYVYMAAAPFAVLVSWAVVSLVSSVVSAMPSRGVFAVSFRALALGATAAAVLATGSIAAESTRERRQIWSNETARYGRLADGLQAKLEDVDSGSRIIIFYTGLPDFWMTSLVQSISGDQSLRVVCIPRSRAETTALPYLQSDHIFYWTGEEILEVGPVATRKPQ